MQFLFAILKAPFRLLGAVLDAAGSSEAQADIIVSQLVRNGHGSSLSRYYLSNWDSDLLMADDFEAWQELNLYNLLGTSELKQAVRLLV